MGCLCPLGIEARKPEESALNAKQLTDAILSTNAELLERVLPDNATAQVLFLEQQHLPEAAKIKAGLAWP